MPTTSVSFLSRLSAAPRSVKRFFVAHKILATLGTILILGGGYWGYTKATSTTGETRYVLGVAAKSTIISSVTASGQVSTSDTVDLKPKVTGEITYVGVKTGQQVKAGTVIAQIDNRDAQQDVADAEQDLKEAQLQLQKDSAQAPIDYQNALDDLEQATTDLETTYTDTFNTLSNDFLALPAVMTGLEDSLYGYDLSPTKTQANIDALKGIFTDQDDVAKITTLAKKSENDYQNARTKYDVNLTDYKNLTRYSSVSDIEKSLDQTIETTTAIAQAAQSQINYLDAVVDLAHKKKLNVSSVVGTLQTDARSYLSTANTNLNSLLAQQKSITTAKKTIQNDQHAVDILKIGNPSGNNPISLQSSESSIEAMKRNIQTLKEKVADYSIVAPFSGTIASLAAKRGDTAGSAALATLITDQKIAELSLNEVDAAKVHVGDKATLSFDAIEDLTLTGQVAEINTVGTVSQGVVSYAVKIAFDTQDERVRPGMTVNASIVTEVRQDVLAVPSSAVKTQNGVSYVQVFEPALSTTGGLQGVTSETTPIQAEVVVGISDDTNVEILSGLNEGEQIVTRTISGTATTNTTTSGTRTTGGTTNRNAGFGGPPGAAIRF